jgi:hypothetical protein
MIPASAPFTYLVHCLKTLCPLKSRSLTSTAWLLQCSSDDDREGPLDGFGQDNLIPTKPALATCINAISVFVPSESRLSTIASETSCHRVSCVELWQRIDVRTSGNSPNPFTLSNSWKTPFNLLAEILLRRTRPTFTVRKDTTVTSFFRSAFDESLGFKYLCLQHINSFDFEMSMSCTKQSRHVTLSNDRAILQPHKRAHQWPQQWPP